MYSANFFSEIVVVSIIACIIGLIVTAGVMYIEKPESLKNFDYWIVVALSHALTGAAVHIALYVKNKLQTI